jgi:hypothetical protein
VTRFSERAYFVFSGLLMIVGSVLSAKGGQQHPMISSKMGELGSDAFYHHFAQLIVSDPNWESVHAQILAAPVLWVLGGLALASLARAAGETRWSTLGLLSTAMGAVLWVVMYIFDGFVADRTAAWMLNGDPSQMSVYTANFGAGQWVAIRTSFVAWLLIAFGTAASSIAMAALARRGAGRGRILAIALVVLGLVLGAASFIASATGAFLPGPMVSPYYVPMLIGTQFWYIIAGLLVIYRAIRQPDLRAGTAEPATPSIRREPATAGR